MLKKAGFILILIALMASVVGIAAAQQGNGNGRGGQGGMGGGRAGRGMMGMGADGEIMAVVLEATGLEISELRQAMQDGSTLADLITANGGSVEDVTAQALALATERINQAVTDERITQERADEILANLETTITDMLNGEHPIRNMLEERIQIGRENILDFAVDLVSLVTEATGLSAQDIMTQVRDGATLAEVVTANGGNVEEIIAQALTNATEKATEAVTAGTISQEQADTILGNLESHLTAMFNGEVGFPNMRGMLDNLSGRGMGGRGENGMMLGGLRGQAVQKLADATGLEVADIVSQLREGTSATEILTANNVNVDAFIEEQIAPFAEQLTQAVADGQISQALADARLNLRRLELLELLNHSFTSPANRTDSSNQG